MKNKVTTIPQYKTGSSLDKKQKLNKKKQLKQKQLTYMNMLTTPINTPIRKASLRPNK